MAYGILKVKNIDTIDGTYCGQLIPVAETYTVPDNERNKWISSTEVFDAITNGKIQIGDSTTFYTDKVQQWNIVLDRVSLPVSELPPYARPDYRTKMDSTPDIIDVEPNTESHIDYKLTEERYVSGGEIVITGAVMGDHVSASIYDKDSVIPTAYRTALCENHPIVAEYIKKMWIDPNGKNIIDTRPLNAKITANLYLRITLHTVNSGSTRKVGINYFLTKKL